VGDEHPAYALIRDYDTIHCLNCLRQNLRNTRTLDAVLRQYASSDHVIELNTRLTQTDKDTDAASSRHVSAYLHLYDL